MNKLNLHTASKADDNFLKLAQLFPNAVTETIVDGEVVRAVDKDVLMQEISTQVVEGSEERYQFTWPDKKKSVLLANAPNYKTLRPCRKESVDFDNTENLYIEGDNLDVLKLLQETYLGKVKMIYIDPPYNTGKDFVYSDKFAVSSEEWGELSGDLDEDGNRMFQNTETNGRYHTDWLNMIYPRLRLAKDLLKDDGVIFISIDDNEVENLKKVCNEVFGAWNFVGCFLWRKKSTSTNVANAIVSPQIDYQLCYTKRVENCLNRRITSVEERSYPLEDGDGKFRTAIIEKKDVGEYARETMKYSILGVFPREGKRWQIGEKTARAYEKQNKFLIRDGIVKLKIYSHEDKDTFSANPNLLLEHGSTDSANKETNMDLFNCPEFFSNPKPLKLLKHLISMGSSKSDIILDFFSGSATTAHAVMQLNAEDGGNRKFIMVQLPEVIDEKHEAYKAGYRTICDIGKERIRRAGAKIKDEKGLTAQNLDTGFRVLKCDSTNMKDVYYYPSDVEQTQLDTFIENIKEDRAPEDLLFQVMLDLGVFLSCKIETEVLDGKNIFVVYQGDMVHLIACFDEKVSTEVVTAIAKRKPYYAVFRDSSIQDDSLMASFEQIFDAYSKETVRKVL